MAQIPNTVTNIIKKYLLEIEKNNIRLDSAYLFGSYAKGNYNDWSDIDIALISNSFSGNRFLDKEKIRKIKTKVDFNISPFPIKTSDFSADNMFINEILKDAVKIA